MKHGGKIMTWSAVDFQRIINIDPALTEQLRKFLNQKESILDNQILHALVPAPGEITIPWIPGHPSMLSFEMVIDYLQQRIRLMEDGSVSTPSLELFNSAVEVINHGLWSYLELLENSVTELFGQANRTGLENFSDHFYNEVCDLEEIIFKKLKRLEGFLPDLENALHLFKQVCRRTEKKSFFSKRFWFLWEPPIVDPKILKNVKKSLSYTDAELLKFKKRFNSFIDLDQRAKDACEKFQWFVAFKKLDNADKIRIIELYRLLKLWEFDKKLSALNIKDLSQAIHRTIYKDRAYSLLKSYYNNIIDMLWETSRVIKTDNFERLRSSIIEGIESFKDEAHTLRNLIANYRQFLLKSDPNPYVGSRWGFVEWVVGPEPRRTKELMKLVFDAQRLEDAYRKMEDYLIHEEHSLDLRNIQTEMDNLLHEMTQPLMSKGLMRTRSERLISLLNNCEELCTTKEGIIEIVGEVLTKALRLDWKYQVLHDIPLFEDLYHIHMGILDVFEDRYHTNRLQRFKHVIHQIQQWARSGGTYKHIDDIENDINDVKELAQDFLGSVQRMTQSENMNPHALEEFTILSRNLLEYRYIFNRFFHQLHQNGAEGDYVVQQFLFLDQYFEAVETRLQDWKQRLISGLPDN